MCRGSAEEIYGLALVQRGQLRNCMALKVVLKMLYERWWSVLERRVVVRLVNDGCKRPGQYVRELAVI